MKTNFLKKALPIGVGMMAVAFAFASENKSSNEDKLITGYIFNSLNEKCESVPQECNNIGDVPCTYMGASGPQIYQNDNGTFCSVPLTHRP
ncbi:DUF6520 family protein [Empedobacter sp. UBA7620]|uniref:DUF6520 family protein n=1 Tax=Empedobacter sp. UBA7620 TaxID=1946452 RepID=UPI0025BC0325|nr:DUF6520 family protein [Empedobacter sp. UBA7620]